MRIAAWMFACLVVSSCVTDDAPIDSDDDDDRCAQQASDPIDTDGDSTPDVAADDCREPLEYDSNGDMTPDSPFP